MLTTDISELLEFFERVTLTATLPQRPQSICSFQIWLLHTECTVTTGASFVSKGASSSIWGSEQSNLSPGVSLPRATCNRAAEKHCGCCSYSGIKATPDQDPSAQSTAGSVCKCLIWFITLLLLANFTHSCTHADTVAYEHKYKRAHIHGQI